MVKCLEACAETGVEFLVLDRPNPLGGNRVEGPGIETKWLSFVGQLPVPYIHGMTAGELARMAKAKGWAGSNCNLTVIPMRGWTRGMTWNDTGLRWVQTSPNIPKPSSVVGYAATSIFGSLSGSGFDVGIGTGNPFEMGGFSGCDHGELTSMLSGGGIPCAAYEANGATGARLNVSFGSNVNLTAINVYLLAAAQHQKKGSIFARYKDGDSIFWKVYGSTDIKSQIERGMSPKAIVAGWESGVSSFRGARQGYLLYNRTWVILTECNEEKDPGPLATIPLERQISPSKNPWSTAHSTGNPSREWVRGPFFSLHSVRMTHVRGVS